MLLRLLQHLTDDELIARIAALNDTERRTAADLVAHLAEMEARDLHLALGYRSLHAYCRAVLHLSEHESYNRMEAARIALRFPVVLAMLADGVLHLTAVRLLSPHLEGEDHLALLGGAIHKTKDDVKELLAGWFPKEDVKTSIRRVPAMPAASPPAPSVPGVSGNATVDSEAGRASTDVGGASVGGGDSVPGSAAPNAASSPSAAPSAAAPSSAHRRRTTIDPLSADTFAVRLTARRATVERLRRAQELLSHAIPDGDVDEILFRALGKLIESMSGAPRAGIRRPARSIDKASRHVPAGVERTVRKRDEDRCAFVGRNGTRCQERRFLELHHVKPWIAGGGPTPENMELRCRAHNQYEAKVYFAPIRSARAWDLGGPTTLVPERVDLGGARPAGSR
jgi:hypothetical protein